MLLKIKKFFFQLFFFSFYLYYISNAINKNNYPCEFNNSSIFIRSFTTIFPISCFSDVTQPARNIFTQNDSCPCPSLHGRSTSCTMPQGNSICRVPSGSARTMFYSRANVSLKQRTRVYVVVALTRNDKIIPRNRTKLIVDPTLIARPIHAA